MNQANDPIYYRRRAEQARALAARAHAPTIAQIHLDMAVRYSELGQAAMPAIRG